MMHKNKSVSQHSFAMVPGPDLQRTRFVMEHAHKTAFNASLLIPLYIQEVLPGDQFKLKATHFVRLATPIAPVMDNLHFDTFYFFVPNRLVWNNWEKFQGEQDNPGDSTDFLIPQVQAPTGGWPVNSIADYFGLPTIGQMNATYTANALPFRAYNLIWNEWFRDQNLQQSLPVPKDDGPDPATHYALRRRNKRHDYFTSSLPWPQKGNSVPLPLGTSAPIRANTTTGGTIGVIDNTNTLRGFTVSPVGTLAQLQAAAPTTGMFADLSTATAATINQLRQSFQIQRYMEKNARIGTRYVEQLRGRWGVNPPDARLQRPEYLGGSTTLININPIAQTGPTGTTGTTTPLGTLSAVGTGLKQGDGFSQGFFEHGYIIGLGMVRADLTYQQGMHRMWTRRTLYDFYAPEFAHLGEQAILAREIFMNGTATDANVFGYQEAWAEYRYTPSKITGLMRSTSASTIDYWHYAERFAGAPGLNSTFIQDPAQEVVQRTTAVGAAANGQQLLCDCFFKISAARSMPMYSVPGLIDHF